MENSDQQIHILLVEDDVSLGYLMVENLQAKGMAVTLAKNRQGRYGCYQKEQL
jgi:DNA-binding response OmpR family regulator